MPLSSSQVSQMMAGQLGMFQGHASYAHQVGFGHGVLPPNMMMGGQPASFGGAGVLGQSIGPMTNMSAGGYGSSMVGGIGGAIGGIGQGVDMLGLGAGVASMFPGALGLSAGAATALGGASLAALPISAGMAFAGRNIYQGAQNISQVGAMSNQYFGPQFGEQGARPGGFMARGQVQQITSILHEIAGQDTMASFADLKRLMDQAGQMGMLSGISNAEQFRTRFKGMLNQVRDIAKVMGSTIEEAAPLFGQMRSMGVWSARDVMGTAADLRMAGPQGSGALMATMGAGAQGSFARGGMMGAGAAVGRATFGMVNEAVRGGIITQESLMELTGGVGGVEGSAMVAQRLTGIMQNMGTTAAGRLAMAGLGEVQSGRYTGRIDQRLMQQFLSGSVSIGQLQQRGMRATANRTGAASFTARQDVLGQNLAAEGGMETSAAIVEAALEKAGFGGANEDIQQLMIERLFGLGAKDAQMIQKMMANLPEIMDRRSRRARATLEDSFKRAEERQNRSFRGLSDALGQAWENQLERPIQEFAEAATTRANEAIDRMSDAFWGRSRSVSATSSERLRWISGGKLGSAQGDLAKFTGGADLNAKGLDEMISTPYVERIRRGGFGGAVGVGGGRGDIVRSLVGGGRQLDYFGGDPAAVKAIGADEIAIGSDSRGRITAVGRDAASTAIELGLRRARSDFSEKAAFGDVAKTEVIMQRLTNKYQNLLADPRMAGKIAEFKKRNPSPNALARYIEGLMREDPQSMSDLIELHGMRTDKRGDVTTTSLDVVALAAKRSGDPGAGIDRQAMGRELGVFDFEKMVQGTAARNEFVEESISMTAGALTGTSRAVMGLTSMGAGALLGPMGQGIAQLGQLTGLTDAFADTVGGAVSREQVAQVMTGEMGEDVLRFLETGELSDRLKKVRLEGGDSVTNKVINAMGSLQGEAKEKALMGFRRMTALKKADVSREVTEEQRRLAEREQRRSGDISGIRAGTRENLREVLKLAASSSAEDRARALASADKLASSLSSQEAAAFRESGQAFAGAIGARATLGQENLTGMDEEQFRRFVRQKVSRGAGYDVMGTLEQASPEQYAELMRAFGTSSAGGGKLDADEATRAKQFLQKMTGVQFAQEQRTAKDEETQKRGEFMDSVTKFVDANTKFVSAVDVALGGQLQGAGNDLYRRGQELESSATSNKERGSN